MKYEQKANAFAIPVRIYYEDTDAAGVVYYANYLKYFERCRTEWMRLVGHDQSALAREAGIAFVVRAVSCELKYSTVLRMPSSSPMVALQPRSRPAFEAFR